MATGKAIDNQEAIVAYREIIEAELSCDVIDYGDQPGLRAIHVVARSGDVELTRELLQRHANVNFCTSKGLSPLHYAVLSGSVPMIRLLLVFGAKVNAQSSRDGKTALYSAAERGEMAVARVLLQYGANSKISNNAGKLPADVAVERGDTDFVQMIQDYETRLNTVQGVRQNTCNGNTITPPSDTSTSDFSAPSGGVFDLISPSSRGFGSTAPSSGNEENENSEAPPSYDEVMDQPALFNSSLRSSHSLQKEQAQEEQAQEEEEEEEEEDEDDDTTALLGS